MRAMACAGAVAFCLALLPFKAAQASKSARIEPAAGTGPRVVLRAATGDVYAACVFVPVGTALEGDGNTGITALLNSVILNSGGVSPEGSPAYAIEALGGKVNAVTYNDYACFRLAAPAESFAQALGILASAVASPKITEYAVESGKLRLEAKMDMARDNPESDAYRAFLAKTYEGTPYALAPDGGTGSLAALDAPMLKRWHEEHYTFSGLVVSVVAGSAAGEAASYAGGAFGGYVIADGVTAVHPTLAGSAPVTRTARYETPSRDGGSAAMLGYTAPPMGTSDYAAVKLAEAVVADGMGSRLFRSLRGDDRLAYSFGSMMPESAGVSRLAFYVFADGDKLDRAVDALKGSVDELRTGGPSEEELDRARASIIGDIDLAAADPAKEAWRTGLYELMGLGPDYGERLADDIRRLDADDVRDAAARYLDKYTLVIIRPDGRIR